MIEDYSKVQAEVKKEFQTMFDNRLKDIQKDQQYNLSQVQSHAHTGVDSLPVQFTNIQNRVLPIHWTVPGTAAATQTNYGVFWTAPFPCRVMGMTEVHSAAGTDAGSVSVQLERLQPTIIHPNGNGISNVLSLKTTSNLVQNATINLTAFTNTIVSILNTGDRLGLIPSGTMTAVNNVTVVVTVQY